MPVQMLAAFVILFTLVSCYPDKECAGDLIFDDVAALCHPCPTGSIYKDNTCECMQGYEFIGQSCVLQDGAVPIVPDAGELSDAGAMAYEGNGCKEYCSFAVRCVGGNSTAKSFLPDIVTGLRADDASACESSCKSDLGSAEATDPAVACFAAGHEAVMCSDPTPARMGLEVTFGLIGQCCAPNLSSALCQSICATLKANPAVGGSIEFCG